jgi:hypothetical protein
MEIHETFTFMKKGDRCDIISSSAVPKERLKPLFSYAFTTYAPIVVLAELIGNVDYAYTMAQCGQSLDMDHLLGVLGKWEVGWELSDGILFSPRPSRVELNKLMTAIAVARMPAVQKT